MTSTYDAAQGESLGWIGEAEIRKGPVDPVFNNFGGEERLWFGPEGSQLGLQFTSEEMILSNYRVQPGLSSQPYDVVKVSPEKDFIAMKARIQLQNLAGTQFDIEVERTIQIVDYCPYTMGIAGRLEFVAFQSQSLVTNLGKEPISGESGPLCCWTLGQHHSKPGSVVVIPVRQGADSELGKPIREDYFQLMCPEGQFPADRWRTESDHILLRADNQCRVKVGVGIKRATNRLGSIDLKGDELVINDFDFYPEMPYVAPYWRKLTPAELSEGEVISVYIDGPGEKGGRAGDFYELETFSPAMLLKSGESGVHRNRVFHIRGDRTAINGIARRFLHTDTAEIQRVFPVLKA